MTTVLNAKRASYFEDNHHAQVDVFYFTSDDAAFKDGNQAANQSKILEIKKLKGGVDMVTRAQYDAWKEGNTDKPAAEGEGVTAARETVSADSNVKQASANAVATAQAALDAAKAGGDTGAIEAAQQGLDAATAQLNAANGQLATDAATLTSLQKGQITRATNKVAKCQKIYDDAKASHATDEQLAPLQADIDAAKAALNSIVTG